MNPTLVRVAAAITLWMLVAPAPAAILEGLVVKIADGDTLTMIVDGRQEKIRLSDIDTPERKQPFGMRARKALADLTFGKVVTVSTTSRDRYGRVIGQVAVGGIDVNAELVRLGFAWVYRKYSDDAELLRLEQLARTERLGLWADKEPIPPWEWRRGRRVSGSPLTNASEGAPQGL